MIPNMQLRRNLRTMPEWVNEPNKRVGPSPPTPPNSASTQNNKQPIIPTKIIPSENDYEIIEFNGQQYSSTTTSKKLNEEAPIKCDLCGSFSSKIKLEQCHKHQCHKTHVRKNIGSEHNIKPPIPPKGEMNAPILPPRRIKRNIPGNLCSERKDQVRHCVIS